MPNYRRLYVPGGTYFFTVNLQDRRQTLLVDHIDILRTVYGRVQKRHPFKTIAICIMPNHLHCIWQLPDGDADFSRRWRLIKTGFSKALSQKGLGVQGRRDGESGIWQRRFWEHMIGGEAELDDYIAYIYFNPVKHGLVGEIADWPHSSWHKLAAGDYLSGGPATRKLETGEI